MSKGFTINKVKAVILSLVIAIVLASFIIYLTESFNPRPEWEDYCGEARAPKLPIDREVTQLECENTEGAKWMNGYCNYNYQCQQDYDDANDKHRFIVFLVAVPAGLIAVALGIGLAFT